MVKYLLLNDAQDTVENVIVLDRSGITEWGGHPVVEAPVGRVSPGDGWDGVSVTPLSVEATAARQAALAARAVPSAAAILDYLETLHPEHFAE